MNRADAEALDRGDALAPARGRFELPAGRIYLDGNSLGAMPRNAPNHLHAFLRQWADDQIHGWNRHGWIHKPLELGDRIGRLVGAAPGQVLVTDSTTINLFRAVIEALQTQPDRTVVLIESDNFPADNYIVEGIRDHVRTDVETRAVPGDALLDHIDTACAAVVASHVNYRTGRRLDAAALARKCSSAGARLVLDLAHSAGVMPVELDAWGVDFAVGCGYKFLNGGPGAPAFVYVAKRHHDAVVSPLQGWLGHRNPFEMAESYAPAEGIRRQLCGTPPMLALAGLEAALECFDDVPMDAVRAKSVALTELFRARVLERCGQWDVEVVSPARPEERGSQVSLRHEHAFGLVAALIARDVVGDYRAPDIARFGFAPLYVRFVDVFDAVETLVDVLETRAWADPALPGPAYVT